MTDIDILLMQCYNSKKDGDCMNNVIKKSSENNMSLKMKQHLPISAITAKINGNNHLISVVSDKNFHRYVVVSDEKGNVIKTILDTEDDSVKVGRDQTNFYVVCSTHNHSKLYKFSLDDLSLQETREFPYTDMGSVSINNDTIYLFEAKEGHIYELKKDLSTHNKIDINEYHGGNYGHSFNYIEATNDGFISIGMPKNEEDFNEMKAFLFYKFGRKIADGNDFIKSVAYDKKNNIAYISFQNFIIIIDNQKIDSILHFKKDTIVSINYDDIDTDSLIICFADSKPLTGNVKVINKKTIDTLKISVKYKKNKETKINSKRRLLK